MRVPIRLAGVLPESPVLLICNPYRFAPRDPRHDSLPTEFPTNDWLGMLLRR